MLGYMNVIAVGYIIFVGYTWNYAETFLQVLGELVCG